MPGITGIIGAAHENRGALDVLLEALRHEPFYRSGTEIHPADAVAAGWMVHPDSYADCLPVWNERRDVCLLFAGEVYPDAGELEWLRSRGHEFEPGNAGWIVHAYEEAGTQFLNQLNGWFSGLIIDRRERSVLLFNDRFGLNRVYVHESGRDVWFSSEAKSLLKALPGLRELDMTGLGEFFSCGSVMRNRTLFRGIHLMPPGSVWTFRAGQPVRKETYFSAEKWEQLSPLSEDEYYTQLKQTWARVLPRYFRGKHRSALSLTGGVDSRMILACSPVPDGELPCYTFGGKYRDCMDVRVAREIAAICRQPHQVIPVNGGFLSDFPRLAERAVYISDGSMDVTGSIDLYVQAMAREIAPVRVTGTNGGEVLRRLVAFKPQPPVAGILSPELQQSVASAGDAYLEERRGHKLSFTVFKQTPWYMCSKFGLERSQLMLRMPFFDNDLVALSYQAPPSLAESNAPVLRLIAENKPELNGVETDRGQRARSVPGVTQARHLAQQFLFKAEYAYDYGMPQWLAKIDRVLKPLHIERLFLGRHKFHHFRVYYRDYLADYLRDVMLDSRALGRSYLDARKVRQMVEGHLAGGRNHTLDIHKLLTAELVQRQLIDRH